MTFAIAFRLSAMVLFALVVTYVITVVGAPVGVPGVWTGAGGAGP